MQQLVSHVTPRKRFTLAGVVSFVLALAFLVVVPISASAQLPPDLVQVLRSVSDDQVIQPFLPHPLRRYEEPVRGAILGGQGEALDLATETGRTIAALLDRLRTLTRREITIVDSKMRHNFLLVVLDTGMSPSRRDYAAAIGVAERITREQMATRSWTAEGMDSGGACSARGYAHENDLGEVYSRKLLSLPDALAFFRSRSDSEDEVKQKMSSFFVACIISSFGVGWSKDDARIDRLWELRARLLYDEHVKSGMHREQYEPIFREILTEWRRQPP